MTIMQIRCNNGHFYNPDQGECPYCKNQKPPKPTYSKTQGSGGTATVGNGNTGEGPTLSYPPPNPPPPPPPDRDFNPVVGWLICTEGAARGRDFRLHSGQSFIGRDQSLPIYLSDESVSRGKHTVLIFDPVHNAFYVRPGDSGGLTYLNGELVNEARPLKSYDMVGVGAVKLLFIPLCGEQFQWMRTPAAVTSA